MSDAIQCLLLDHGFHNYTNGPCCHTGGFDVKSYQDLHRHPTYIEIKQTMAQGQWHAQCGECASVESKQSNSAYASKRQIWDDLYREIQQHKNERGLTILSYDVGKLCNLACRSCGPTHSSSWLKEYNHMNGKAELTSVDYDAARRPMDITQQSFRDLKSLELLGGEPLYNPESYKIMQRAIEETNNQCVINITSNGTIFPDLDRYPWFRDNPMIVITFSIDAIGPAAEFIRTGTNWIRAEHNISRYRDIGVGVGYHVTHSVLNLFELDKIEQWRIQQRLPPCKIVTVVTNAPQLSFQVLTDKEKQIVCSYLDKRHGQFLIPYIESSIFDADHRQNFFNFMTHTKDYHHLDWKDALPALWQLMHTD